MSTTPAVWGRIVAAQGSIFRQKRGKEFTFRVVGDAVVPSTTDWSIPRAHVEVAVERMPVDGPGKLQDLYGPSYLFGILMDQRIRGDDW